MVEVDRLPEPHVLEGHYRDHMGSVSGWSELQVLELIAAERAEVVRISAECEKLRAELGKYANIFNWDVDDRGIRRVWLEPGSTTPTAYNGFESARAALATPTQGEPK